MASKSVYAGSKVVTLYNIKTKQDICLYRMHSDKITALKSHPNKDYIMSASKDKEICLWDINRQGKQAAARLNLEDATHPSIAFDPKGVCFAVGATVKKRLSYSCSICVKLATAALISLKWTVMEI